jgi:hypothetical protein
MACTWTIVTTRRTLTITGEGSPVIVGGNSRCINLFGPNIQLIKLSGDPDGYCSFLDERIVSSSSANCTGDVRYDCLNGNCKNKLDYNTPGIYNNLTDCQAACGSGTPCNGECIPAAEITALNQAITDLQGRYCP